MGIKMKSFKLIATLFVLYFGFSAAAALADDSNSQKLSYEINGSTFSAVHEEGTIKKLVRNNKVVYRSSRTVKQASVKQQIKSLSRDIKKLINLESTQDSSSAEAQVKKQMNKLTIRLSRK
jgi:hypothetical protein